MFRVMAYRQHAAYLQVRGLRIPLPANRQGREEGVSASPAQVMTDDRQHPIVLEPAHVMTGSTPWCWSPHM